MSARLDADAASAVVAAGLADGRVLSGTRPLSHWLADGNARLADLRFDDLPAALELWDFVLSEEERLRAFRAAGGRIIGAMKDLGTVPVLVDAVEGARAFYPDGAFWLPCLQRGLGGQLAGADRLGIGESFCPVRALLSCYADGSGFPLPDLDVCAVGATCDDFSAVAQRLAGLGRPILWWELPAFREPDPGEAAIALPDGTRAPARLAEWIAAELARVAAAAGRVAGRAVDDAGLRAAVERANRVRALAREIRATVFAAPSAPLSASALLLAEVLCLHYCSDRERCELALRRLLAALQERLPCCPADDVVRVCWINPVADLRALDWLEEAGGRLAGSDFMTAQALAPIPMDVPPLLGLARAALCDRMIGDDRRRARLALAEARRWGAEAVVLARIPGASHCHGERDALARELAAAGGLPLCEIEVPPLADAAAGQIRGRLAALMETARARRSMPA